jgi:hypothetical protein
LSGQATGAATQASRARRPSCSGVAGEVLIQTRRPATASISPPTDSVKSEYKLKYFSNIHYHIDFADIVTGIYILDGRILTPSRHRFQRKCGVDERPMPDTIGSVRNRLGRGTTRERSARHRRLSDVPLILGCERGRLRCSARTPSNFRMLESRISMRRCFVTTKMASVLHSRCYSRNSSQDRAQVRTRSPQGNTGFDRKHEFIFETVFLEAVLRERRADDDSSADRGFELWPRVLNESAKGSTATGPGRHR